MAKQIVEIVRDPRCQTCKGCSSIPNPLSRPRTWRKTELLASRLVSNLPGVLDHPRARARLLKLRNVARRYQSTRPCPHCATRRRPRAEDAAKRLGIELWHPHVDLLRTMERSGLLSWSFPSSAASLYTVEHVLRTPVRPIDIGGTMRV